MRRALVLSSPGEAAVLIDPDRIDPATGEWQAMLFDNDYPGPHKRSEDCYKLVASLYAQFLAANGLTAPAPADNSLHPLELAYRAALAGDRSVETTISDYRELYGWRAWALTLQLDAFSKQRRGNWTAHSAKFLWDPASRIAGMDLDRVLSDPVITEDIMPLFVVSFERRERAEMPSRTQQAIMEGFLTPMAPADFDHHVQSKVRELLDFLIDAQPSRVTEMLHAVRTRYEDGGGLTADFSYAPAFATAAANARALVSDDPLAAWDIVAEAVHYWEPRNPNHLVPVGLLWDQTLSPLLHDIRLRHVIRRERGLDPAHAILETPRGRQYLDHTTRS